MSTGASFKVVESPEFTRDVETTIGIGVWTALKPALEGRLARDPHKLPQIANTGLYAVPLNDSHAIYFTIDFNHALVVLQRIY